VFLTGQLDRHVRVCVGTPWQFECHYSHLACRSDPAEIKRLAEELGSRRRQEGAKNKKDSPH
jgi:hypothetical protein